MRWRELLLRAEAELGDGPFLYRNFSSGGWWMEVQLWLRSDRAILSRSAADYNKAGFVKYGLSVLAATAALMLSEVIGLAAIPLSVLAFYYVEVHFLFLFPLLADGAKEPYRSSIRMCRRLGALSCLVNVLPLAIHMLTGLLKVKDPFRGWHIGCLAVLIWYVDCRQRFSHE